MDDNCPLCGRTLAVPCTRHHLLPVSKGGKGTTTVLLHKICHDKIHRVFSEKELQKYYNTVERLREAEAMREFIHWVRKKDAGYYDVSLRQKRR
ncbi:MAG: HNH endonuclease [Chitinophagaceae bacterium]|nr:HNH endonuclease [Chitinophagaceae bacterium]